MISIFQNICTQIVEERVPAAEMGKVILVIPFQMVTHTYRGIFLKSSLLKANYMYIFISMTFLSIRRLGFGHFLSIWKAFF